MRESAEEKNGIMGVGEEGQKGEEEGEAISLN